MHTLFEDFFKALRVAFFPDRCALCNKVIPHGSKVCRICRKTAPVIRGYRCSCCGHPENECSCRKSACHYDGITAPFLYKDVVRKGIHNWKFRGFTANTDFFAEMISSAVKESFDSTQFDMITFVPQTKTEEAEKEYNQSEILARALSEKMNIPAENVLIKLFETPRQHDVPSLMKSGNVFGVFDCIQTEKIKDRTILLTDDIRTSGNTINECAKMLKLYGAKNVCCAVIAISEDKEKKKCPYPKK